MPGEQNNLNEAVFLTTVLLGTVLLIAAVLVARLNWRPDVPPFTRRSSATKVLLHPKRYAQPNVCLIIRVLAGLGVLNLMVAVLAIVRQAILQFAR